MPDKPQVATVIFPGRNGADMQIDVPLTDPNMSDDARE